MADSTLIGILGVVITVFFGAVISLLVHYDKERRKDMNGLREEMRGSIVGLREETKEAIGGLRGETEEAIGGLRGEMRAGFAQVNRRIDLLLLHLVPQPAPGVVQTAPEPPTKAKPELLTGTE